jgi:RNA polymerase sigma-70 factor (sigma-E family)
MMTAGNDTAGTREDELFTSVYQQIVGTQAAQYEAAYDASAGLERFTNWLQDHAAPELAADQVVAELYSLHYRPLLRLATLLVRDLPTAENIVLDAFIATHRGWSRLGDADDALAYLRQAVVNRCRSVLRHRTVADTNPHESPPEPPGIDHAVLDLLQLPAARAALDGLPRRQREAIVLRYYSGLPEDQVAAAMRISRGAVKSHTARGLSALRSAVEQAALSPAPPEDSGHEPSDP